MAGVAVVTPTLPVSHQHFAFNHCWPYPRFLQIRLGNESCDKISASPNGPKRAKARDSRDKSRETCDRNASPPKEDCRKFIYSCLLFVCIQSN